MDDDEAVLSVAGITGADYQTAKQFLELADGNADAAVSLFFESGGSDIGGQRERLEQLERSPVHHNPPPLTDRAPIPPRRDVLVGGSDRIHQQAFLNEFNVQDLMEDDEDGYGSVHEEPLQPPLATAAADSHHSDTAHLQNDDVAVHARASSNMSGPSSLHDRAASSSSGPVSRDDDFMLVSGRSVGQPLPMRQPPPMHDAYAYETNSSAVSRGSASQARMRAGVDRFGHEIADAGTEPFRNLSQEHSSISTGVGNEATLMESREDRLARLFQPPYDIMFQGPFDNALTAAREKDKWVMVTIHDPIEFACQVMNRDLWKNQTVKELIRENFVFVQYGSQSTEGKMHLNFYPIDNYPYIGIVDSLTGERVKLWRVQLSHEDFVTEVIEFLDRNPSPHHSAMTSTSKSKEKLMKSDVNNLSEEEQIKLAIAQSMSASTNAPETNMAGGASSQNAGSSSEQGSSQSAKIKQEIVDLSDSAADDAHTILTRAFASIPAVLHDEPAGPPATVARTQIRFPDGSRLVYKFNKSDRVRSIFEVIKAKRPDLERPFDLMLNRKSFLGHLDESIDASGVNGASLTLDFI